MKRVAIIGAGLGGLAAAARLSFLGYQVDVYEQGPQPGGRAGILHKDGFSFDTGPTLLMMPAILYQLFEDCGAHLENYLALIKLDPGYQVVFSDSTRITMFQDLARLSNQLAHIDTKAPRQFYRYFADIAKLYHPAIERFVDRNFDHLSDFLSLGAAAKLISSGTHQKLPQFLNSYFSNPQLIQLFSYQALYLGVSPANCPAIYAIISYLEAGLGIYYPKGGMHKLPLALAKLTTRLGGQVHLNSQVKQIVTQNGRIQGLELSNGEMVMADIVISNADLRHTHSLLGQPPASTAQLTHSPSAVMFFWGLKHPLSNLEQHSIYIPANFDRTIEQIFTSYEPPDDPAFYVHVPTKTDTSLAPPNNHVMSVLVPTPNLAANIDWKQAVKALKRQVLKHLKVQFKLDIESSIITEAVTTPHDFAQNYNLFQGSAFGLSHTFMQSGYFRPHNYVKDIAGLYLAGADTYPGSGVPMVLLSGKLVVERIIKDLNANTPSKPRAGKIRN